MRAAQTPSNLPVITLQAVKKGGMPSASAVWYSSNAKSGSFTLQDTAHDSQDRSSKLKVSQNCKQSQQLVTCV